MSRETKFWAAWLLAALIVLPVTLALITIAVLSLGGAPIAPESGPLWTLDHYSQAARTYLTRTAFLNSLYTTLIAVPLSLAAGWAIFPALQAPGWAGRITRALVAAVLLTPIHPAMLVWRELWDATLWLTEARTAILAAGLVLGWRLTPVAVLLWWIVSSRSDGSQTRWLALAVCALILGWLAAVDLPVVYLLTRGEPFNTTHTAATWAMQQAWVARHWAQAAVILVILAGLTAAIWGALVWLAIHRLGSWALPGRSHPTRSARAGMWDATLLLPLPLWVGLLRLDWTHAAATGGFLWQTGAGVWLANNLAVMMGAGFLAWALTALLHRSGATASHRIRALLPLLGMLGLVVWYLPLGWLQRETGLAGLDSRLVLMGVWGVTGALLVGGLKSGKAGRWASWTAAILAQQDLALSLFLQPPSYALLIGPATVLQLAGAPAYPQMAHLLVLGLFPALFLAGLLPIMWSIRRGNP